MMPNQLYRTIEAAIKNAPLEPGEAHYEIQPLGLPAGIRVWLQAVVRRAVDAGLKVTIHASGTTLKAAGMLELQEFEGAAINRNDSRDPPGYFHLSISRRMIPGVIP
jgi:hypothetical protein